MRASSFERRDSLQHFRQKRANVHNLTQVKTVDEDYEQYERSQENLHEYVRHLKQANQKLH